MSASSLSMATGGEASGLRRWISKARSLATGGLGRFFRPAWSTKFVEARLVAGGDVSLRADGFDVTLDASTDELACPVRSMRVWIHPVVLADIAGHEAIGALDLSAGTQARLGGALAYKLMKVEAPARSLSTSASPAIDDPVFNAKPIVLAQFDRDELAAAQAAMRQLYADTLELLGATPSAPVANRSRMAWLPVVGALLLGLFVISFIRQWNNAGAPAVASAPVGAPANAAPAQAPAVAGRQADDGLVPPAFASLPVEQQQQLMTEMINAAKLAVGTPDGGAATSSSSSSGAPQSFDKDQVAKIFAAGAIEPTGALPPGIRRVVAFEDPQCTSCQRLARASLELNPKTHRVAPIPVAFFDGSREMVAKALCAKDPVVAWRDLMVGSPITGEVCEKGLKTVDDNTALFKQMQLDSTPSIVAPNGKLVVGDGSAQAITRWIDAQFSAAAATAR